MSVKVPTMYQGMYLGQMYPAQADLIMQTRQTEFVPNLEHMVFDFGVDLVKRSLDEFRSIRSIIQEEGIDHTQYIGTLRKYQTVGTAFMYLSNRSIIADGVGLGKTVEIAALLNYLKQSNQITRFLIAVETSALGQTQYELMRFTGLNIVQLPSEAPKMKKAIMNIDWNTVDGIVIKHSALRSDVFSKWLALNLKEDGTCKIFNTFILDESSVIKNMTTKTSLYTKNICDITTRVHFMNATVFETNILDVYNQVEMINSVLLPRKSRIEKDFCTFGKDQYWTKENGKAKMNFRWTLKGYKHQAEFKESLKLSYFGRCSADIGMDMPHTYKVYEVEPSNEQTLALAKGYRYMEVLNCPSLVTDMDIKTTRENVPKLDRLIQLVENDFYDQSVMVYCFHNEAQAAIARELKKIGRNPVVLNGKNTDAERWEIQTKFNKGEYDCIVTNIKKSLNLYGGSVCIFYSAETNPSKIEQIRGRIDRHVDDKIKTFVLILYKGTDEYKFFMETVKQRAQDARSLTIDAKSAVDFFMESMLEDAV